MKIEAIKQEIQMFIQEYFKEEQTLINSYQEFIKKYNIIEPRENYTLAFEYLNSLINQVKDSDYDTINITTFKMHREVNQIHIFLMTLEQKSLLLEELFLKKVMPKSKLFQLIEDEITKYKEMPNLTNNEHKTLKLYQKDLREIYQIYFDLFLQSFHKNYQYYMLHVSQVLNTKIFYLDKLLWSQISSAKNFRQRLRIPTQQKYLGSRFYILHKLKIILPYSKEYKYLQICLRIFK